MKKSILALLAVATVSFYGCQEDETIIIAGQEPLNIIDVMKNGKKIENANFGKEGQYQLEGSMETLTSLRHVSRGRVYYMDYKVQFPWQDFIINPGQHRFDVNDFPAFNKLANETFYGRNTATGFMDAPRGCSGFICNNEKGELLFGRNLDGVPGQMVILFNRNVPKGEYKSVMLSNVTYANRWNGSVAYDEDGSLLESGKDLSVLLKQSMAIMDGMNEHGLCFAAYQLPNYQHLKEDGSVAEFEYPGDSPRPWSIDQQHNKPQITLSILHNRILSTCRTVEDVKKLFQSYDYTCLIPNTNVHWFVADASGKCCVFEYWTRPEKRPAGMARDTLYIMDTEKDRIIATHGALTQVPYERNSIENYYCNPEAAATYNTDRWQVGFSNKTRVHRMMSNYYPVMSEEQALRCLQEGNFGMELPAGQVTDWSCIYNPKQGTLLFNMRDDLSEVYYLNIFEELAK